MRLAPALHPRSRRKVILASTLALGLIVAPARPGRPSDRGRDWADRVARDSLTFSNALRSRRLDSVLVMLTRDAAAARRDRDLRSAASLLRFQGIALVMTGNPRAAVAPLDEALRWSEANRDTLLLMTALRWRAYAAGVQGRLAEQERMADRLVGIAQARGDTRFEAIGHNFLGWIAHRRGQNRRAIAHLLLAVHQHRLNRDLTDEAVALTALGSTQMALGEYDAARATYGRQIEIARALGFAWSEAQALNDLGSLESEVGDPVRAESEFRAAYRIHRSLGETDDAMATLANLAARELDLGRYEEAAALAREGVTICRRHGYALRFGELMDLLADAEEASGRTAAADSVRARVLARDSGADPPSRIAALLGRARRLERAGRSAEALAMLGASGDLARRGSVRDAADMERTRAWLLLEAGRVDEALRRARATAAEAESLRLLDLAVSSWRAVARCEGSRGNLAAARAAFERGGRCWEAYRRQPSDPQWREWRNGEGNRLAADWADLLLRDPSRPESVRVAEAFDALQRFKTRTLLERMGGPRTRMAASSFDPVSLRALRREVLGDGELLLEWYVSPDTSYLFAVSRDRARVVRAPGEATLRGVVDRCRARLADPSGGDASAAAAPALETSLLAEVADRLAAARRVTFAPDGPVYRVPFAALARAGGPLPEATPIASVPSATVLALVRGAGRAAAAGARVVAFAGIPGGTPAGARDETRWLAGAFRGVEARPLAAALDPHAFEGCEVVHVAGHAAIDDQFPWRSAIGAEPPLRVARPRDTTAVPLDETAPSTGALRAEAIASRRVGARLVVLSSCQTAAGRILTGEGVAGLSSAFLAAGAPTVIATLWPVDDWATSWLMRELYARLARGETVAAALRGAQLRLQRDRSTRSPYYWAGFVVVGDGDTRVRLERRIVTPWRLGVVLLLLALAAMAATSILRSRRPPPGNS